MRPSGPPARVRLLARESVREAGAGGRNTGSRRHRADGQRDVLYPAADCMTMTITVRSAAHRDASASHIPRVGRRALGLLCAFGCTPCGGSDMRYNSTTKGLDHAPNPFRPPPACRHRLHRVCAGAAGVGHDRRDRRGHGESPYRNRSSRARGARLSPPLLHQPPRLLHRPQPAADGVPPHPLDQPQGLLLRRLRPPPDRRRVVARD